MPETPDHLDAQALLPVSLSESESALIVGASARLGLSTAEWTKQVLLRAAQRSQDEVDAAQRHADLLEEMKPWISKPQTAASKARWEKEHRDWEAGKVLSAAKVARLLRLSAPTVIKLMKNGTIPARGHHGTGRGTCWFCHRADIDQMFRHPNLKLQSRLRAPG